MYSTTQLIGESKILRINQIVLIYFILTLTYVSRDK
jgi:hypothetical protein